MYALTRAVSDSIAGCELTHLERTPIDIERARAQHAAYVDALRACGCTLLAVPPAHELPDAVFVEDTAVVLDQVAVITRPGAPSRRAEVAAVADALARHRPVTRIAAPATLDGGDVLRVGRSLFVGASGRTNALGIAQLRTAVSPFGYEVVAVPLTGCLHLKTAVTPIGDEILLCNTDWVDPARFPGCHIVEVASGEPFGANALRVGSRVIYPAAFRSTAARLEAAGIGLVRVDVSELARAEGGVTCCSIVFR